MKFHPAVKVIICFVLIWLFSFSTPALIAADTNYQAVQSSPLLTDYSVTLGTAQTIIGNAVSISWEAPEGHPANDYIRLAKVSDPDSTYSWSQTLGTLITGSFNVTVPNTVARYEFRLYRGSDNQRVAQSPSFIANKTDYSITAAPLTIATGGQITVDWSSPAGRPVTDRIVITSANNSTIISQQYTSGVSPKTIRMTAPLQPGEYEIRYLETGVSQPSALSQIITVETAAGSFAGQVKKGETGEYITGALVEVLQGGSVKAAASTNSNGSYAIPLATAGTYDLRVTAANFPVITRSGQVLSGGNITIADFALYNTGSLSGKITKNGGLMPISGASVQLKQGTTLVAAGNTDFSGNYNFSQLPPGTYSADITASGFSPLNQTNIAISAGSTTTLNLTMTPQSGSVSDLEYMYDDGGRIVATKEQGIVKNIYNYDLSGNLLSITAPQGNSPSIISFSPRTGLPGTQVVIRGINFSETSGQNAVSFNGVNANVTSFSATEIVTFVPVSASTGNISVTTPNGTAVTGQQFVVEISTGEAGPTISGFSPVIGHPGDMVTITGSNFESEISDNSVMFGASGAGIISGTSTSLLARANTSSGKISVTTPNGTAVSQDEFVSVPASIDPAKISYSGQTWFGNNKFVSIPAGDKLGAVTFDGVYGKRFSLQIFNLNQSVKIEIYRPDGRLLSTSNFNSQSVPDTWFIDTQSFPLTGTYTAIITPATTTTTTNLNMIVYDVPPDGLGEMPFNTYKTISIGTPGQNGVLTYNATAGQKILMNVKDSTYNGSAVVRQVIAGGPQPPAPIINFGFQISQSIFSPDGVTIPATGTYSIALDPSGPNTGPMTVSLFIVPPDLTYSMTIGSSGTFSTTSAGQNAWVEFSGTAGQRISLQTRDVTFTGGFAISLNKPDGTSFVSPRRAESASFIDTLTLPATGVYKILINPDGYYYGQTTIDLFNVPPDIVGSTTINGTPATATAAVPGQNPTITFDGLQGQQARVNISGATFPNDTPVRLKKPDGTLLVSGSINSGTGLINSTTLPVAGTYRVEIDPAGINLGSADVSVGGDVFGSITPGGSAGSVTINNPGQSAWLSFNGTAGQKVSLKLTNVTFNSGSVSFRNPDGSLLGNILQLGTNNNFLDTVTLPSNGTYKVLIDPVSNYTGSATLNLYNVPSDSAGTISIGGNAETRSAGTPGQNLSLSFTGTANQQLTLETSGVTIPNSTQLLILKSDGGTLNSAGFGTTGLTLNNVVLPEAGTYTIFINPTNDDTGSVTLQLYGAGTGSNPNIQLWQAVAVQKGLVSNTNNEISAAVSVKKGVYATSDSNSIMANSVSVTTGPNINNLSPGSAIKGNSITLTITGNNFSGASAVRFYSNGNLDTAITATNINVNAEGTVLTATVQVNTNAAIGERVVVIATPSFGLSVRENTGVNILNIIQ